MYYGINDIMVNQYTNVLYEYAYLMIYTYYTYIYILYTCIAKCPRHHHAFGDVGFMFVDVRGPYHSTVLLSIRPFNDTRSGTSTTLSSSASST